MEHYMTNQDMIDLAFGVPAHEYNCYSLIGEIAERVAQFNDYNTPTPYSQRYAISMGICAGTLSIISMDLIDPSAASVTMGVMYAKSCDALALNEVLEMVIFLSKELTV